MRIKGKNRGGSQLFTNKHSDRVWKGRDYALQNEIDEAKEKTQNRACFKMCRTCGKCANSHRDSSHPFSHDSNVGKKIDCRKCEPFSFHDCHNGVLRDTHQDAEPFTFDMLKLLEESGGKPLI